MSVLIDSSFVGTFKTGDNMSYTARVLKELYLSENRFLVKPKVVFNTSLIDAALYDFFRRIRGHTKEFSYLDDDVRDKIRKINIEKVRDFKSHIYKFRHHQLLGGSHDLYESLYSLNMLRNRVHIQNEKGSFEADERHAFTQERLILSEKCTEFVLCFLSKNYPRKSDFVGGIELPWDPHFDSELIWIKSG